MQVEVRCLPVNIFSAVVQRQTSKLHMSIDKWFHRALPVMPGSVSLPDIGSVCMSTHLWLGQAGTDIWTSVCVPGELCLVTSKVRCALPTSVDGALCFSSACILDCYVVFYAHISDAYNKIGRIILFLIALFTSLLTVFPFITQHIYYHRCHGYKSACMTAELLMTWFSFISLWEAVWLIKLRILL